MNSSVIVALLLFAFVPGNRQAPQRAVLDDARLQAVFGSELADSPDGSDFELTAKYRDLVAALLEFKPGDVEAQHPIVLDYGRAMAEPAALRGNWVSVQGYVALRRTIVLDAPIAGTTTVERAVLKIDAERAVVCDLIGDPPPFKNQADTIKLSGVFYRTVTFEADSGKITSLPYVLARSLELVDTPSSTMAKSLIGGGPALYVGILAGLVGVIAFVMILRRNA